MVEELGRRNPGGGIMEEESWRRNQGGETMEEKSWRINHGGGITEDVKSGRINHGAENMEEESERSMEEEWCPHLGAMVQHNLAYSVTVTHFHLPSN